MINTHKKKKKGLALLAGIPFIIGIAGIGYGYSAKEYQTIQNATYQGYNENEGFTTLIFDSKPLSQRGGSPEHRILGNPNSLGFNEEDIGKNFDLTVRIPRSQRLFPRTITKADPVSE